MFLDADQLERDVLDRNTQDSANLVIAQAFEPQQDDASVDQSQRIDPLIKLLYLQILFKADAIRVKTGTEVQTLATFLLPVAEVDAIVQADAVNPRPDIASPLEAVKALPQADEYFLVQVVHLVRIFREHVADGINSPLMFLDYVRELLFFRIHSDSSFYLLDHKRLQKLDANPHFFENLFQNKVPMFVL